MPAHDSHDAPVISFLRLVPRRRDTWSQPLSVAEFSRRTCQRPPSAQYLSQSTLVDSSIMVTRSPASVHRPNSWGDTSGAKTKRSGVAFGRKSLGLGDEPFGWSRGCERGLGIVDDCLEGRSITIMYEHI